MKRAQLSESEGRLLGLYYNALYMLDWQIGRVRAGVVDEHSARLLKAGVATARYVYERNIAITKKYSPSCIARLIEDGLALLEELAA
jgi:hypothetical protein